MQALTVWLKRCEDLSNRLGIFSSNEEVEDIATGDLKYLLVTAYLGDVQSSSGEREPHLRKTALEEALDSYTR